MCAMLSITIIQIVFQCCRMSKEGKWILLLVVYKVKIETPINVITGPVISILNAQVEVWNTALSKYIILIVFPKFSKWFDVSEV